MTECQLAVLDEYRRRLGNLSGRVLPSTSGNAIRLRPSSNTKSNASLHQRIQMLALSLPIF